MTTLESLVVGPQVVEFVTVAGADLEVGVLADGTPFMSGRGLAKACGVSNGTLVGWGDTVPQVGEQHRAGKLAALLVTYGYGGERLFSRVTGTTPGGGRVTVSAYPHPVCMAFLDYYAFEANKEAARNSLRVLSDRQLPQFIQAQFSQGGMTADQWSHPTEPAASLPPHRGTLPPDYFSLLHCGEAVLSLQTLLQQYSQVLYPIHIERAWHHYWAVQKLWIEHGPRVPYERRCLDQAPYVTVEGYITTYLYPCSALAAFQHWLAWVFIPDRSPSYLHRKQHQRPRAFSR